MPSQNLRICFVTNSVSGTSIPVDISIALSRYENIDVDLISYFGCTEFDHPDWLTIRTLEAPQTTVGFDKETYLKMKQWFQDYDLIHTHHPHSGFFSRIVATRLGIPVVSTEHNTRDAYTSLGKFVNGISYPLCNAVTCVSDTVRKSLERWEQICLSKTPVQSIYNGIDIEDVRSGADGHFDLSSEGIANDDFVVGCAAMLTEQKGHDTLIRAIARANEVSSRTVHLVLSGDGPLKDNLEELTRLYGIEHQVHFLGYLPSRSDVYELIDEVDIFCMPSRWEGYNVAVAEAMTLGKPCILSDIPVFRDVYRNIPLYHDVDDGDQLADRILELERDPELMTQLSKSSKEFVESNHRLEDVARKYASLYSDIVS